MTDYRLLADVVLVVHALFIAFVVFGLLLILAGWLRHWRWVRNPWFRYAHLGAILFVVAEAWFGVVCPLTALEDTLRRGGGDAGYSQSFVADWLQRLIFFDAPLSVFAILYSLFALLVVGAWILAPPRRSR